MDVRFLELQGAVSINEYISEKIAVWNYGGKQFEIVETMKAYGKNMWNWSQLSHASSFLETEQWSHFGSYKFHTKLSSYKFLCLIYK